MLKDNILKQNKKDIKELTLYLKQKLIGYYEEKYKIEIKDQELINSLFGMVIEENYDINNILTISEIAEIYKKDDSNLRKKARTLIQNGNEDIKKSGSTFLLKRNLCEELWGTKEIKYKNDDCNIKLL